MAAGCGGTIVAFSGTVPQAALDLDGTYRIIFTDPNADTSQFPDNPTLAITGGLLTRVGNRDLTPTNVQANGNNVIWASAAVISYQGISTPLATTITVNVDVQPDMSLVGTIVLSASGRTSNPIPVELTQQ
jgi:hypothetical protein